MHGDNFNKIPTKLGSTVSYYNDAISRIQNTPYASDVYIKLGIRLRSTDTWQDISKKNFLLSYQTDKHYKAAFALGVIELNNGNYEKGLSYLNETIQFLDKQTSLDPFEQQYYISAKTFYAQYSPEKQFINSLDYISDIESMLSDFERSNKFYEVIYGEIKPVYKKNILIQANKNLSNLCNIMLSHFTLFDNNNLQQKLYKKSIEYKNKALELENKFENKTDIDNER